MKVTYSYKEGTQPLYISDSNGVQRILLTFKDNNNTYVYFCDDYLRHTYLNKIINTSLSDIYSNSNFSRIETDEEFYYYLSLIEKRYNYNGKHIEEKIDGHDLGGAVLIGVDGKPLL